MWFLACEISPSTLRGVSFFVVDAETLDGRLHHLLLIALVVDDKILGITLAIDLQGLNIASQHAHAEGVKRADGGLGERVLADNPIDPLGHLGGGFVGKRDGENAVGRDVLALNQISDAIGDDTRLARTGAGQNEHRGHARFRPLHAVAD